MTSRATSSGPTGHSISLMSWHPSTTSLQRAVPEPGALPTGRGRAIPVMGSARGSLRSSSRACPTVGSDKGTSGKEPVNSGLRGDAACGFAARTPSPRWDSSPPGAQPVREIHFEAEGGGPVGADESPQNPRRFTQNCVSRSGPPARFSQAWRQPRDDSAGTTSNDNTPAHKRPAPDG